MVSRLIEFIWNRPWILLVVSIWLAAFTGDKLFKMAQINGWIPGAETKQVTVVEKKTSESVVGRRRLRSTAYWLIWNDGRTRLTWNDGRTRVTQEVWQEVQIGDTLELRRLPGEGESYYRGGIYASRGSVIFDLVLLCLELLLFFSALTRLFIRLKQPKRTDGS